jgi:cytochrome P450
VVLELIAARRRQPPRGDVLDLLLAAQDEQSGAGMSDEQLKDEAITILTAGHETGGAALSWALYLLAEHPEVQQALHAELSAHLQGRQPVAEDLASLPLVTAVFEETMRLYPPAWGMPRETIEPDVINGFPLPAKATLVLSQWVIHRHPDFWPRPNEFDPIRFLASGAAERPKFAFFPFGGGQRICIGNAFAMIEGPLILAAIVSRFQFELIPGQQIVPDPTFTLRPKPGVRLTVSKRA